MSTIDNEDSILAHAAEISKSTDGAADSSKNEEVKAKEAPKKEEKADEEAAPAADDEADPKDAENDAGEGEETEEGEETAAGEGEETDEKKADAEKRKNKPLSVRMKEMTKARRDAERRARDLERQLEEMRHSAAPADKKDASAAKDAEKAAENKAPTPPDAGQFKYGELDPGYKKAYDAYLQARDAYVIQQAEIVAERRFQAAQQSAAAAREAQEQQKRAEAFKAAGSKKYKDFEDVVIEGIANDEWPLTQEGAELVLESEVGADIAYYLASHPDEAAEIARQTPLRQAALIGRIEARFLNEKPPAETGAESRKDPVSKAPPPTKSPRGAGGKFAKDTWKSETHEDILKSFHKEFGEMQ